MKTINNQQLRIMHSLLNNLNLMEFKADFVQEYSNGRVQSSKGLSEKEANELIDHLKKLDPSDRLRKKVISNCYQIGLIYGHTAEDKKMNLARCQCICVKTWLPEKGAEQLQTSRVTQVGVSIQRNLSKYHKEAREEIGSRDFAKRRDRARY